MKIHIFYRALCVSFRKKYSLTFTPRFLSFKNTKYPLPGTRTMGLDLVCGSHRLRAGSYSTVMEQWTALLRVYILFLRESVPEGVSNAMDVSLQKVENRRLARQLEDCLEGTEAYSEEKIRRLSPRMYAGMRHLLLETKSTGSWSALQARDILRVLQKFRPFFSRLSELVPYVSAEHHYYLEPILRTSVRLHQDISFA